MGVWQCWWGRDKALGRGRWSKIWDKEWNVSEKGGEKNMRKEKVNIRVREAKAE